MPEPYRDQNGAAGRNDAANGGTHGPAVEPERARLQDLDPGLRVPRDAYDRFRRKIIQSVEHVGGRFGKEATEVLMAIPDLFLLFAGLARDPRVSRRHKLLALAVTAYLLSPVDLLPEALLGPLGMLDDIALAFLALDALLNRVPRDVLLDHWRGERDLLEVARLGTAVATQVIPLPVRAHVLRWLQRTGRNVA